MPRAGQLPVPQGGGAKDFGAATLALNVDNCFSIFFDPQFGHAGLRVPLTSSSAISPQDRQTYSNSGMGGIYFAARSASTSTLAWRRPTKSAAFLPFLKITR